MLTILECSFLRHGGEADQQTRLWPGLRADPEAAVPHLGGPANLSVPEEERPVPGGDPEEAGGRGGEEKGNFPRVAFSLLLMTVEYVIIALGV